MVGETRLKGWLRNISIASKIGIDRLGLTVVIYAKWYGNEIKLNS